MVDKSGPANVPDHVWVAGRRDRYGLDFDSGCMGMRGVALAEIANAVGTPTYVYDAAGICARLKRVRAALAEHQGTGLEPMVCYAVKANPALAILRLMGDAGAGADIVSGGELHRAIAAGIAPDRVVFSGVAKTDDELDAAIAAGVLSINVESSGELRRLAARANTQRRQVRISLRVNPDVDPATHPYLATGLQNSKFGVSMADATELVLAAWRDPWLQPVGIGCHIGSQIFDITTYRDSLQRLEHLVAQWRSVGIPLAHLDAGGGIGVAYKPGDLDLDVGAWAQAVGSASQRMGLRLLVEPGRYLVAESGILLTRVIGCKNGPKKNFVIVDAGMNDLIRPALYQAYHAIVPARQIDAEAGTTRVDVVGPVCESGDFLALDRALPAVQEADLLVVMNAGAYGMAMASAYNSRSLPAEVLVDQGRYAVIRGRTAAAEALLNESIPPWLYAEE